MPNPHLSWYDFQGTFHSTYTVQDEDHTPWPPNPNGWAWGWLGFEQPSHAGQVQVRDAGQWPAGEYLTPDAVTDAFDLMLYADTTTYIPAGVSDAVAWQHNALVNVVPYIEVQWVGDYRALWVPLPIFFNSFFHDPDPIHSGSGLTFRYISATTDARTGLPYDYSLTANTNDRPFGCAIVIACSGTPGGRRSRAQWLHGY